MKLTRKKAIKITNALENLLFCRSGEEKMRILCAKIRLLPFLGRKKTAVFLKKIFWLREILETDLQWAMAADPAAQSDGEIRLCYPGFYAVTVYRLAHELYLLDVPLLPRMMTEIAHSRTGIDIHPGACIGDHFFIDHGTGVVIGQTAVIGRGVKLYHGVTIGCKNMQGGQRLHGVKRHPTLQDYVTVYANATILGGDTVIGTRAIIGANAFVMESVAPGSIVTAK